MFRLAVALSKRVSKFIRPPLAPWLLNPLNKGKNSYTYWMNIYWATPSWLNDQQQTEMKEIYNTCPETHNVDHIVPIRSKLVCGLHVPWNLQHLTIKDNSQKSNLFWPDHPFGYDLPSTQMELF